MSTMMVRGGSRRITALGALALLGTTLVATATAADWDPALFGEHKTLEFLTIGPEEGEHWTTVWVVVLDGDPYIRLGTVAAGRMERNTTKPLVKLRVGGKVFAGVRAEPVPEMVDRVQEAMAAKYWMDIFVRHAAHPLTMRLRREMLPAGD